MSTAAPAIEASNNVVRDPRRIFSKDVKAILANNPKFTDFPIRLPQVIRVNLSQIEELIIGYAHKPEEIQIDHVETLGLPQELIDQLTAKAFELCEMIDNADNDNYPNHLSRGSLTNVAMSCIRRAFYIAVLSNPDLEQQVQILNSKSRNPKFNPYPFVEVDPQLLEYLSQLFLRIYESELTRALIPLYFACILQLCCYTKFVVFNVQWPMEGIRQTDLFDSIFRIVNNSMIPSPGDNRYWVKPKRNNRRNNYNNNRSNSRFNNYNNQSEEVYYPPQKKEQERPSFPLNDFSRFPSLH